MSWVNFDKQYFSQFMIMFDILELTLVLLNLDLFFFENSWNAVGK